MHKFARTFIENQLGYLPALHIPRPAALVAGSLLVLLASGASANETLAHGQVSGAGAVQVTAQDIEVDMQRIPPEVRPQVLEQQATMNQLVTNLYLRRAIAQKAEADGIQNSPSVATALVLARDKVLSDALLALIDKANQLTDAQALELATTMYKAKPGDFVRPEQVRVRHILITPAAAGGEEAAKAKAEKLLEQLKSGSDFAALAKEHSNDPGSAEKGGDVGLFASGRMVPEFEAAAFALQKPGELSGPVKSQFGYHLIQFTERKPQGVQPFDEVREGLVAKVKQLQVDKGRVKLVDELKATMKLDESAVSDAFKKALSAPKP
ncbi:peptidylprolyl isomerase [Acidovorax sp.]|uniref:peptidylprolyl isomerase n=1 Tax=Acidovorax sp. TaxID=1872122 RepID=UPI00262BFBE7|nr:peptidylprolyl isomerase [Acidovorax sp.]